VARESAPRYPLGQEDTGPRCPQCHQPRWKDYSACYWHLKLTGLGYGGRPERLRPAERRHIGLEERR
jgi:hypothetical protein